ncbi:gamma-glutamyltransferase family protein [Auraticoccus sp. F435]|uniref:Gamma-glutamyltransferase family protein n=1 Tax=Auraticoccus cholistanensis TaxID=2656650 RepID=A0A6A9V0L1_9ACTN|nr:gamma-glutamyltransferase [Auraticoccus cholistanensis]MVA75809.1 gamma-glutamyltransferase family protein [Auraticoccus cholistanensis]
MSRAKVVTAVVSLALLLALVATLLWVRSVTRSGVPPVAPAPSTTPAPSATTAPTPTPTPTPTPSPTPTREPGVEAAVTIDPAATEAAMDVLADGGTAADAAVAAAAVLSVVEPYYSNVIAGETAMLWYDASEDEVRSLQGVGYVGEDFDRSQYRARGVSGFGLHQSLVPGSWDMWMTLLQEQGELGVDEVLAPAVELARDGFPASAALASQARAYLSAGGMNSAAQEVYAPGGVVVSQGDTVVQEDFADTLESLAEAYTDADDRAEGIEAARDLVYRGALAEEIVAEVRDGGGWLTADDLAGYEAVTGDSITLEWDDETTVHQVPPSSQGLTMLMALNTLRTADLADRDEADAVHLQIEALKLALADREAYVGDPEFTDVPVEELLDPDYGEQQLERIDLDSTLSAPVEEGLENTTTFQVVDADGNAAAVTTSTGYQFTQAGGTGIMMNNRMRYMTDTDSGSPNYIEPGKRVRYTGNPWMVTTPDGLSLLGGNIGGDTQSQVQTQHFLGVVELGLSPEEAVEAPRFVTQSQPNSVVPHGVAGTVRIDQSTDADVLRSLRDRGQQLQVTSGAGPFGTGSVVRISDDGQQVELGLDPRAPSASGDTREP